jgi:membrane protease YdiL (CAAX protease family)
MEWVIILQIFLFFILPPLMIYARLLPPIFGFKLLFVPFKVHTIFLSFIGLLIIISSYFEGLTLFDLGIRFDNFKVSFLPYLFVTIFALFVIFIYTKKKKKKPRFTKGLKSHFLGMFLVVSIFQEFAYRAYLIPKLLSLTSSIFLVIVLNALLFVFLHSIFLEKKEITILLFFFGLIFASVYVFYPNLILASISHAILNFMVVLYGFFVRENKEKWG